MDQRLLSDLPCWVEVLYTDSMNAKIAVDGSVSEVSDISIDDLTGVLKEVERLISEA
jgi:hypothetical protein